MLRLATRAGMAHITKFVPLTDRYARQVPYADGFFVVSPERVGLGKLYLLDRYLPYCPLRIIMHSLSEVRSSCPVCLSHHTRWVALHAIEYFNCCPTCDLAFVDVILPREHVQRLLPFLSHMHYLRTVDLGGIL